MHLLGVKHWKIINGLQCENKREEKKINLGEDIMFQM